MTTICGNEVWEVDSGSAFKYVEKCILKFHTFMEKRINVWIPNFGIGNKQFFLLGLMFCLIYLV